MKYLTKNIRRSELMDLKWIAQVALKKAVINKVTKDLDSLSKYSNSYQYRLEMVISQWKRDFLNDYVVAVFIWAATEKPEYKAFRDAYLTTYMETANMQAQIAAQNFFNKFSKQKFINTLSAN